MKLNVNETLRKAEESGQIYRINKSWRILFTAAGVLCCLLIIGLPLGIWIIIAGRGTRIGLTDEGFAFKGIGSHGFRWDAIEAFRLDGSVAGLRHHGVGGLIGNVAVKAATAAGSGLKGRLNYKLKGKGWRFIPAHTIEGSVAMAEEMERRTGLQIFPKEEA